MLFTRPKFESKEQKYMLLTRDSSNEAEHPEYNPYSIHSRRGAYGLLFTSIGILLLSVLVLVIALTRVPTQLECAKITSPYSPMWEAVEFIEGDADNDFLHNTIYRGPPTAEREEAWDKLWHYGPIGVPPEGIAALNKTNIGQHHKTVDEGKGVQYGAMVEVFHQMHCLNLIRQYTWLDLYDINDTSVIYPEDLLDTDPVNARIHVDHCFEALRIDLMCYGDVTPLLFDLDPTSPIGRKADFNIHQKCRKFDKIVDWTVKNSVWLDYSEVHSST